MTTIFLDPLSSLNTHTQEEERAKEVLRKETFLLVKIKNKKFSEKLMMKRKTTHTQLFVFSISIQQAKEKYFRNLSEGSTTTSKVNFPIYFKKKQSQDERE